MLGEITQAILQEVKTLLKGTGATVMLKTNFQIKKLPDYNGNLVLMDIEDAPDSVQYPGGLTRMDWKWGFGSYNWEPDAYVDDDTDYSTGLLDFIDKIRVHFTANFGNLVNPGTVPYVEGSGWLTQAMGDVFNIYGFQLTLTGLTTADALDAEGLVMGSKIGADSTAFDKTTNYVIDTVPMQTVMQRGNPPFSGPGFPYDLTLTF